MKRRGQETRAALVSRLNKLEILMHLSFAGDRMLAVVAHPDDAELLCAGTLARARADGAAIGVCVLCQGDKGQPAEPIVNLAAVRLQEMTAATALLVAELFAVNVPDGTLADDEPTRDRLVEIYRTFRPTLILAHWTDDYHPDHRAAGQLAEAASWFAASRGRKTASPPLDQSPALWWMDAVTMSGFEPAIYIDVIEQVELKSRMLACHISQLARGSDKDFAPLDDLMRQQLAARGLQAGVAAAEAFRPHVAFKRTRAW